MRESLATTQVAGTQLGYVDKRGRDSLFTVQVAGPHFVRSTERRAQQRWLQHSGVNAVAEGYEVLEVHEVDAGEAVALSESAHCGVRSATSCHPRKSGWWMQR